MTIAILSIVGLNASCKSEPSAKTMSAYANIILKRKLMSKKNITEGGSRRGNKDQHLENLSQLPKHNQLWKQSQLQ